MNAICVHSTLDSVTYASVVSMPHLNSRSFASLTDEERAFLVCRERDQLLQVDGAGRTQLHLAAQAGKAAVCRIFLNAGIDPGVRDNSGRTAADLAGAAGYKSLARTLEALTVESQVSPNATQLVRLLDAQEQSGLMTGDQEVLDRIIASGRVNSPNAKGDTPLHLAAASGHMGFCHRLFEAGADALQRNNAEFSASDMAAEGGHQQLADLLDGLRGADSPDAVSESVVPEEDQVQVLEIPAFEGGEEFDQLAFDAEENPNDFHSRQEIVTASAAFLAIPSISEIRIGDTAGDEDWELPGNLTRVRQVASGGAVSPHHPSLAAREPFEFVKSNRHETRRPRKLTNTSFRLSADTCRDWSQEVLAQGHANGQAISDLVGMCQGNHVPTDLAANIRKLLDAAGIPKDDADKASRFHSSDSTGLSDADDLSEAIHAACNRDTVLPGYQAFKVDRESEGKFVRRIANARQLVLSTILDTPELLTDIVRQGDMVLSGEIAADAFTDLEVDISDDDGSIDEFSSNLETLRQALKSGTLLEGRSRRHAIEALTELEISGTFLATLAARSRNGAGAQFANLLETFDRLTEEFLLSHLPYARRETAKAAQPDEDPEELFQEAYFAMRRAIERFDPNRGVRFYIYAQFWIRQHIGRWRSNTGSLIRVPVHRYELQDRIVTFNEEFEDENLRPPTETEVSEGVGCDVKVIKSLALALSEPLEFAEVMGCMPDHSDTPEEHATRTQSKRLVRQALEHLDERQQQIVRMRFGIDLDTDMTLEEVGKVYGVTRERIRQIEAMAIRSFRHPVRRKVMRDLL